MSRAQRLAELLDELGIDRDNRVDIDAPIAEPERWLLVERYRMPERTYVTVHETPEEAAEYHTTQEDPFWYPVALIDLDTGKRHEPRFMLGWEYL